ncbi:MAG: type II toxin-antitoxin system RatA family toxin [Rhodobacteraceae bacterium]|nr:type II toxin-antitoxin system RatA family toxin [Paracoccaceae bacterium]
MPSHAEKRKLPWSADEMYGLVADVEAYPQFLPWCSAARNRARRPLTGGAPGEEVLDADLVISFKVFRERFGSRVTLRPGARVIEVEYLDGPFRYLHNRWVFIPREDGGCEVDFSVDFEFRNRLLQTVIGVVFGEAVQRMVRAFETRAAALYGPRGGGK